MAEVITTEYDGCGKCLVGVRRLSRMKDATSSPEKQLNQVLAAVEAIGGHIIAWADDWEVSGATDPRSRPGFGPWLRDEMGPYDGIAGAMVDRIGRNVHEVTGTAYAMREAGRILVTADHPGVWDLNDANQEAELAFKALGAQMEHRAIKKRNQDETVRARAAGQPKQKPSYGYRFVRLHPTAKIDHVTIDETAAEIIREVAERILSDQTGKITVSSEAARLTRAGVPSPTDHRAIMYGREPQGHPWNSRALKIILTSQAALGYLMHGGRPVLGPNGQPRRLAEPLWDAATRNALIEATNPKPSKARTAKGINLLSGLGYCGTCGQRLYNIGRADAPKKTTYGCTARTRGVPSSQHCKPAPSILKATLNEYVTEWFLKRFGTGQVVRRIYDPGTGYAAKIKELENDRKRLRDDRAAGLYDADDDAEWYRTEYARIGREITELKKLPERPPGMRTVPTGRTVADDWHSASDDAARREILTSYSVRVTLAPTGPGVRVADRVTITALDVRQAPPTAA